MPVRFENSDFYRNVASRSQWQSELTQYAHYSLKKLRDDLQPITRSTHRDVAVLVQLSKLHHAVADVQVGHDLTVTVMVLDAATRNAEGVREGVKHLNEELQRQPGAPTVYYVATGAQSSPADCVMFSLTQSVVLHEEQVASRVLRLLRSSDLTASAEEDHEITGPVVVLKSSRLGEQVLPASLFQNSHSLTVLEELSESDSKQELMRRRHDHLVRRNGRSYSAAIEVERWRMASAACDAVNTLT